MKNETLWKLLCAEAASIFILIIVGVIYRYGTSSSAADWVQSILTACAICAAIGVPLWVQHQDREARFNTAEIIVASQLRAWMRSVPYHINANALFFKTDGQDGKIEISIPNINLSYEQISNIRPIYIEQALPLFEMCNSGDRDIVSAWFYSNDYENDTYEAFQVYCAAISDIFWKAQRIYKVIAQARGLNTDPNREEELKYVREAQSRGEEYVKERLRSRTEAASFLFPDE